jgi:mono/diheme cytochrome c family protein
MQMETNPGVMRRISWLVFGGLFTVVLVTTAATSVVSERKLRRTYDIAASGIAPTTDSLSVLRGSLLARDLDCDGCHGEDFSGAVSFAAFGVGQVIAPNLTVAGDLTDAQWELAIRFGLKRNGEGMIGMPSRSYYYLTDADVAALIGYFRNLEPVADALPETRLGPLGRLGLALGWFDVEPELVDRDLPRDASAAAPPEAYGKYVGMTNCGACHGTGGGQAAEGSSNRLIPESYSDDELLLFLRSAAQAMRWVHRFTETGGWR